MTQISNSEDHLITSFFEKPNFKPPMTPNDISWDEKQEQARVARERKRYEATIDEITTELEFMRSKVAELLEKNNELPESERYTYK